MKQWARYVIVLGAFFLSSFAPLHASEQRVTSEMIKVALNRQGFDVVSETATLLGRVRFVAVNDLIWREVILDLSTGQIIRDYAVEFSPTGPPALEKDQMPRGGTVLDRGAFHYLVN